MKEDNKNQLQNLRHSTAHLLAAAILELYPEAKRTIGPAIENGFYYDFDFGDQTISENDFPKIEQKMHEIVKSWNKFERLELARNEAMKQYNNNSYKQDLIEEFSKDGQKLTFYKSGDYSDLCKGGHIEHPDKELKYFKLLSIAGAYWRGSEKNKMLTRIYGTAFPTKDELEQYLILLEEAKKRDHRKLGKELDLYHFQPDAPGIPFWHSKGMIIRNELINFSREIQQKYGYKEVRTPMMLDVNIFKQSGHWDHYKNDMFFTDYEEQKVFGLKPMNCPGMIQIYKATPKSYRDLPLYLSEYGLITRKEKSGELNGLFRVMQATQDDAHLFMTKYGIADALESLISLTKDIYSVFGVKYKAYLSTRPDDFMGEIETWNFAEDTLKKAMGNAGLELLLKEKDGAFYGPKIDYQVEDSLGRTWQCATLQLDFQMPETFDLEYTDKEGTKQRPVMIHRTIIGSMERFIGILTEHFAGKFPLWLSPVQIVILPIADRHLEGAREVYEQLLSNGIRAELDDRSERLQAKIRDHTLQKVPFMGIIGDREIDNGLSHMAYGKLSVRTREGKDLGQLDLHTFISDLKKQIDKKVS